MRAYFNSTHLNILLFCTPSVIGVIEQTYQLHWMKWAVKIMTLTYQIAILGLRDTTVNTGTAFGSAALLIQV